jgi:hypothetical protein
MSVRVANSKAAVSPPGPAPMIIAVFPPGKKRLL